MVGIGKHAIGIDGEPRGLGGNTHATRIECLGRRQQNGLIPLDLLHTDSSGKLPDHGHVGEGGASRPSTVEHGRHLPERPRQVHGIRSRFRGHGAGAPQP